MPSSAPSYHRAPASARMCKRCSLPDRAATGAWLSLIISMAQAPPYTRCSRRGAENSTERLVMINKILCASILTSFVTAPAFNVAHARTVYDGTWNLYVETQSGDCTPAYQFQVEVVDGIISYQGPASVQGRVSSDGAVSVSVSTETQRGSGSGKLTRGSGRGRWSGSSSTQRCSGSWTAQRYR